MSKLQTTIALSTVESEYVALSTALRDFIPVRDTASKICKAFHVNVGDTDKIKSTVWEDNSGCLKNAQKKRITPRTHHINVAYHWFWSHIGEDKGITIEKIDTSAQKADLATKALDRSTFEVIRKLLMGW